MLFISIHVIRRHYTRQCYGHNIHCAQRSTTRAPIIYRNDHNLLLLFFLFFCSFFFLLFFPSWLEWQWQNDSTDDDDESKLNGLNKCRVSLYPVTENSICATGKSARTSHIPSRQMEGFCWLSFSPFLLFPFSLSSMFSPSAQPVLDDWENTVVTNLRTQDRTFTFEREKKRRKRRRAVGMDVQPRDKGPPDSLHGHQSWYHFLSLYFNITWETEKNDFISSSSSLYL